LSDKSCKEAIILMGHGSRVPSAGENMEKVAKTLLDRGEFEIIEICYMERLGPYFPEAFKKCVDAGADKVLLIPYFLHMGLHTRVDIPTMMRKEAKKYQDVKIVFGKNLGFDELIVELVKKRIGESLNLPDVREVEIAVRDEYPLEKEMEVFVPMSQEEAVHYKDHLNNHEH